MTIAAGPWKAKHYVNLAFITKSRFNKQLSQTPALLLLIPVHAILFDSTVSHLKASIHISVLTAECAESLRTRSFVKFKNLVR